MTGRQLLRELRHHGCEAVRQRGSHVWVRCGRCGTTFPVHASQDLPPGLLRKIERDLEPRLAEDGEEEGEAVRREDRAG